MHKTGRHSKATITRASGLTETLLDKPYNFREQQLYRVPDDGSAPDTVLRPGDTITMTCTFENDTASTLHYGGSSDDEMCFLTAWAWPAGSINNGSPLGTLFAVPLDQGCVEP
jgi:hypothetical protein